MKHHTILAAIPATLLVLAGCGESDHPHDVGDPAHPDVSLNTPVEPVVSLSHPLSERFGIASYSVDVETNEDVEVVIEVTGLDGAEIGQVRLSNDGGDTLAVWTEEGRERARVVSQVFVVDDVVVTRDTLTAAGQSILLRTEMDADGDVSSSLVLITGADLPHSGEYQSVDGEPVPVFALEADGADVDAGLIGAFMERSGLSNLTRSSAALRLLTLLSDPVLAVALNELAFRAGPVGHESTAEFQQALHLSSSCQTLVFHALAAQSDPDCEACFAVAPDWSTAPTAMGPLPATTTAACRRCALSSRLSQEDVLRCLDAWQNPGEVYDDERCIERMRPARPGLQWTSAYGHHGCREGCGTNSCFEFCDSLEGSFTWSCAADACQCYPNEDTWCEERHPGIDICRRAPVTEEGYGQCRLSACGDGERATNCHVTEHAERCDDSAPVSGCADDQHCVDCGTCEECECQSDADCEESVTICDGCACVLDPGCDTFAGFVRAGPDWCDPAAGSSYCAAGERCAEATCTCYDPTLCGNGFLDDGEDCDESGGTVCLEGPCVRCACNVDACGNGSLDAEEECDESAGVECSEGSCVDCGCVANELCGNGTLDTGRGEECDPSSDQVTCSDEFCVDCRCQSGCGDRTVEGAEECNPPVARPLPDVTSWCDGQSGFYCAEQCLCQRTTCGDGVFDEARETCDVSAGVNPCTAELGWTEGLCDEQRCSCVCPESTETCTAPDGGFTRTCMPHRSCDPTTGYCHQTTCPANAHRRVDQGCECDPGFERVQGSCGMDVARCDPS